MAAVVDRRRMIQAVAIGMGPVLAGCPTKVVPSDLLGKWSMSDESIGTLGLEERPSFILEADGGLFAENLPASAFGQLNKWRQRYNGKGRWSAPLARRTEGFSALVLHFESAGPKDPTGLILEIDKDSKGIYLFAWLDEEGGERLIFRRLILTD